MSQPLFGELDLLHSNQGVLIGTAGLVVMWITLTLLERRGRRVGALVSRTVKRPLTLGPVSYTHLTLPTIYSV